MIMGFGFEGGWLVWELISIMLLAWFMKFGYTFNSQAAAADDDVDLFGEETEEEKKAAEERSAAIKASAKKKECKLLFLLTD